MITSTQLRRSRIGLAIVVALFVATFFIPVPAPTPLAGEASGLNATSFTTYLAKGEEMTIFASESSVTCREVNPTTGAPGFSLRSGFLDDERVVDGTILYPVAGLAGVGGGTKRLIQCNTATPLYQTTVWLANATNIGLLRGAMGFLGVVFGWYVVRGPMERRRRLHR